MNEKTVRVSCNLRNEKLRLILKEFFLRFELYHLVNLLDFFDGKLLAVEHCDFS